MPDGSPTSRLSRSPIFLIGVPRSGTTLLRMVLDAHPDVMCGPEAPWIAGRGFGRQANFRDLTTFLIEDKWGAVSGFTGVHDETVYSVMANALDAIMLAAARELGKKRWAEKTPENILAVPFLHRLFPDAKFVHIIRDGRDVALSTSKANWKKIPFQHKRLRNTYANALKRWVCWVNRFLDDAGSSNLTFFTIRYEYLVRAPHDQLRKLVEFLELGWSDRMLHPHDADHDVIDPKGEGVTSFFERQDIDTRAVFRWKKELSLFQRRQTRRLAESTLRKLGYAPTAGG